MENFETNLEKRRRVSEINEAILRDSLSAYGIEYDKVSPKLMFRLEDVERELADLPKNTVPSREEITTLWKRTSRRDPDKEGDIKRQEVLELVETSIGVQLTEEVRIKLREIINDILDFEDRKREERKEWDKKK